jgi:hypothetical protein
MHATIVSAIGIKRAPAFFIALNTKSTGADPWRQFRMPSPDRIEALQRRDKL